MKLSWTLSDEASKNKNPTPSGLFPKNPSKPPVQDYIQQYSPHSGIYVFLTAILEFSLNYRGFSRKPPGGGVFIFASLKMNQEKNPLLEIGLYRLWVIYAADTKSNA